MDRYPLFSVIVITYNSAPYVLETLNSISSQNYNQLELIISDDCSSDETIALCEAWLSTNKERFVRAVLLKAEKNQGIPANCNQGLKEAKGSWVKFIAGDDAFFPLTFENAAKFIGKHPSVEIFASSFTTYDGELSTEKIVANRDDSGISFYKLNAKQQNFLLVRNNYIHAGTVFLKRLTLLNIGGFNEKYKLLEDHPMWLSITEQNVKVFYMPFYTLKYRLHFSSVFSHTSEKKLFNNFYLKKRSFELDMVFPKLRWYEKLSYQYTFYIKKSFDRLNINQHKMGYTQLYHFLMALSPVAVINWLKKNGI